MQTQRGLGASKVSAPSVGGTINIVTKSLDAKAGGSFAYGIGNDGTVGGTKQVASILGNTPGVYAQAYFSYSAKKSGGSHHIPATHRSLTGHLGLQHQGRRLCGMSQGVIRTPFLHARQYTQRWSICAQLAMDFRTDDITSASRHAPSDG